MWSASNKYYECFVRLDKVKGSKWSGVSYLTGRSMWNPWGPRIGLFVREGLGRGEGEWWVGPRARDGNGMFPALLGDQGQTTVLTSLWVVHTQYSLYFTWQSFKLVM